MSSAMFIHRTVYLKAQVREMRASGYGSEADQVECIIRKVERGTIKTVAQLTKAQEEIIWTR